ncbi:MAG: (d)CMP kinase [Verrucomicrobia bacterium]|nr:(d)CMP kinase [Verrucomicrobiota bacterium]
MIIAIDGPAGTGKTTVAHAVAQELGFIYFDTGAMYRALTYGIISQQIDLENAESLQQFLDTHPVTIKTYLEEKNYYLGQENVTDKIRSESVTKLVSKVSSYAAVREKMVSIQRSLAEGVNAVFEGRDIGTVVFPKADLKVFLTADLEIRAKRRRLQNGESGAPLEQVAEQIASRDAQDAGRALSPMKAADDAIVIDTTELSIEEVVNKIINLKESAERDLL